MFFKKKVEELERALTDKQEEPKERVVRKIIDGKLYDTSKAVKITSYEIFSILLGVKITCTLYKGNEEWFEDMEGYIFPKTEAGAKKILAEHDVDKYIQYFGEPELA